MSQNAKEGQETQVRKWRTEAERHRRARLMEAFFGLMVLGALISFTLWHVAHNQRVSDERWCDLLTSIDKRNQALKNPSAEQQEFIAKIHELTMRMHC